MDAEVLGTDEERKKAAYARVGRLASFGLEYPWQTALFLPSGYIDCRDPDGSALNLDKKVKAPIRLKIASQPSYQGRSGPPRLGFNVVDGNGDTYPASVFGDTKDWLERLTVGSQHLLMATGHEFGGRFRVTLHELLPEFYAGRIIPQYPAPKARIAPEELRRLVARYLREAIPQAASYVAGQLEAIAPVPEVLETMGAGQWTLELLLQHIHYPRGMDYLPAIRATIKRIAALAQLYRVQTEQAVPASNPLDLTTVQRRMDAMPFVLTDDQRAAILDVARDVANPQRVMNRVVSGDCGCGKTAIAGVACAAVADVPGRRAMILFPSTLVAQKSYEDFRAWFPDLAITLVTGETGGNEDMDAQIIMGTSALLHREVGRVDLLVIDEQHRFAVAQREFHRDATTHYLEMSATCIPRTQALVRFGHTSVSEVRQTHQMKFIETQLLVGQEAAGQLMSELRYVIRSGAPLFVIYPRREAGDPEAEERHSIESAAVRWEERFPGKVVTLTGMDDEQVKNDAIAQIRSGEKQILLSTSVVEVGVDVSALRHIIVIDPQNYGLVQLHQLRGRVARQGGEGWCYLLAPKGIPAQSRERLQALLETTDGFKIAEADLRQRGAGDISADSTRQHGADGNILHGAKIDLQIYDQAAQVMAYFRDAA